MSFDFLSEHFAGVNEADLDLTCSLHVCANVNGNKCSEVIDKCGYGDYNYGRL